VLFVIGLSDSFGSGFKTLNRKPLCDHSISRIVHIDFSRQLHAILAQARLVQLIYAHQNPSVGRHH